MKVSLALVLLPDKKLSKEVAELSEIISGKYKIRLEAEHEKVPLHISLLFQGGKVEARDALDTVKQLREDCLQISPFKVRIDGFGYFMKTPRFRNYAVYLRVTKSRSLSKLRRLVNSRAKSYAKREFDRFVPHITLTRGSLSREKFFSIKREYRDIVFKRSFVASGVFVGMQKGENLDWRFVELRFLK